MIWESQQFRHISLVNWNEPSVHEGEELTKYLWLWTRHNQTLQLNGSWEQRVDTGSIVGIVVGIWRIWGCKWWGVVLGIFGSNPSTRGCSKTGLKNRVKIRRVGSQDETMNEKWSPLNMENGITVFFMVSSFSMKLEKIPRFVGVFKCHGGAGWEGCGCGGCICSGGGGCRVMMIVVIG